MVVYCVGFNCNNRASKNCGLSFHKFPQDPELRRQWVKAVNRKGFTPTEYSRLCSAHFHENDYEVGGLKRQLKKDAVPTKFDFPSLFQPTMPKKRRVLKKVEAEKTTENRKNEEESGPSTSTAVSYQDNLLICDQPKTPQKSSNKTRPTFSPKKTMLRKKVKILQDRLRRRNKRIRSMKEMIAVLKDKVKAPERLIDILNSNFSGLPLNMLLNTESNAKKKNKFGYRYTEQMKEFALTLFFYTPKAYNFVRKSGFCLPNPSTIRAWISHFNCSPGFLNEVLLFLKENIQKKPHLKHLNLVFDCMSIRKQLIYDPKSGKYVGYTDLGSGVQVDHQEELATESLVFQVVSFGGNFKCAIGYFLINSITSHVLSQLIKTAIFKLKEAGVSVHSVTCDGTTTNVAALQKLGCELPNKSYFSLKGIDHNICVMLDAAHMLKLARNTLADKKVIVAGNGNLIEFKYIEKLLNLQTSEGLKLANNLSHSHVFFKNKKMNVKLAAQMLSSSVATALDFLSKTNHANFQNCEETVRFIKVIDRLFDCLNTRNPWGKHFKEPIKKSNLEYIKKVLRDAFDYLSKLEIENVNILKHPRKTFALGLMTNIHSVIILSDRLLNEIGFKYILTYKFSQDHLELLFSCIRSRGGDNDNPNVQQFRQALRKLMFRNRVQPSREGNCLQFDENQQNSVLSFTVPSNVNINDDSDDDDDLFFGDIISNNSVQLTDFKENVLYYICGFVVRKVDKAVDCEECSKLLYDNSAINSSFSKFTSFVSNGKLIYVTKEVFRFVKYLYILFLQNKDSPKFSSHRCILSACMQFQGNLFTNHVSSNDISDESHALKLMKMIGTLFYKTVCFSNARNIMNFCNKNKLGVRQKFKKLVLFQNM